MAKRPLTSANKHELNRQLTRQLIVNAAKALMIERGYTRCTMEMIADSAGVSRSSLYRHFETKWQVAKEFVSFLPNDMAMRWQVFPNGPEASVATIAAWLKEMMEVLSGHRQFVFLLREIDAVEPEAAQATITVNEQILAILQARIGGPPSSDNRGSRFAPHLCLMHTNQFFYMSLRSSWGDSEPPYEEMAASMMSLLPHDTN